MKIMKSFELNMEYSNPIKSKFDSRFFTQIPRSSGIYIMRDENKAILYIGKAKDLRARISSYRQAKPGIVAENVIEMIENVDQIEWELCPSEKLAFNRESELLRAIRPPFNIANVEAEKYLYIGFRICTRLNSLQQKIQFKLSSYTMDQDYKFFGCFRNRSKIKSGYCALLRLLYAAQNQKQRFIYPAKITRASPPYLYTSEILRNWITPLELFFYGESSLLLEAMTQQLLSNLTIPEFMYSSLQRDIEVLRSFYEIGPKFNHQFRKIKEFRTPLITHGQMDRFIASDLHLSETVIRKVLRMK